MEMNNEILEPNTSRCVNSHETVEICLPIMDMPSDISKQHPENITCSAVTDDTCTQSQLSTPKSNTSCKKVKQLNLKMSVSNTENAPTSRRIAMNDNKRIINVSKSESSCCTVKSSANLKEVSTRNGFDGKKVSKCSASKSKNVRIANSSSANNENAPTCVCIADNDNKRDTTNTRQKSERCSTNIASGDSEKLSRNRYITVTDDKTKMSKPVPEIKISCSTHLPSVGTKSASAQLCSGDTQDKAVDLYEEVMPFCSTIVTANTVELSSALLYNGDTQDKAVDPPQNVMSLCSANVPAKLIEQSSACSGIIDCHYTRKTSPSSLYKIEILNSTLVPSSDDSSIKSHFSTSKSRRSRKRAQQSNIKTFATNIEDTQASSVTAKRDKGQRSSLCSSKSDSTCSTNKSSINAKEPSTRNSFDEREDSNLPVTKSETSCIKNLPKDNSEKTLKSTHFATNENKRKFLNQTPNIEISCTASKPTYESVNLPSSDFLTINYGKRENSNHKSENEILSSPNLYDSYVKNEPSSSSRELNGSKMEDLYFSKAKTLCCESVSSANTKLASSSSCFQVNNNKQEKSQVCVLKNTINDCSYLSSASMENVLLTSSCIAVDNDTNNKPNLTVVEKEVSKKSTNTEKLRKSSCIPVSKDKTEKSYLCTSKLNPSCKQTAEEIEHMFSINIEQTPTSTSSIVNHNVNGEGSKLVISKSDNSRKLVTECSKNNLPNVPEQILTSDFSATNDNTKELSNLTVSKRDNSSKIVEKPEINASRVKTPQLKTSYSKLDCKVVKSYTALLKTEKSYDHNMSMPSSTKKLNLPVNCSEAKDGKRKTLHRSKSAGSSLKEKNRNSDKSSSEDEGIRCRREKQNIARQKRKLSKSSSLSKIKGTVKENLDNRDRPIADEFNSKDVSQIITCENKPIKISYSQLSKCSLNENINKNKEKNKVLNIAKEMINLTANAYTHENEAVIARSLQTGKRLAADHKTDIAPKNSSANMQDENIQLFLPNICNEQEVKSENISTKVNRRRKNTKPTEIRQKENCTKIMDSVSSTLDTVTRPTNITEERGSRLRDKSRPKRERKQTSRRNLPTKTEEVRDESKAIKNDNRNSVPNSEANRLNAIKSNECCSNSTSTSTGNRSFLRMLFTSIARFFGRKESKPKTDNTSKAGTASVSKSGNTLPTISATNEDDQNKLQDVSTSHKTSKQNLEAKIHPLSVNSKDKIKPKNSLKGILKKKPIGSEMYAEKIRSSCELSIFPIGDQKHKSTMNRENDFLSSTSKKIVNSNEPELATGLKKFDAALVTIYSGSSMSCNSSPSASTVTLGPASVSAPLCKQHQSPFKRSSRYTVDSYIGKFKSMLSTVSEPEEIFRRHSEEDLTEMRKLSEEEKHNLEYNLSDCDEQDAQEINRKLKLMLRHKGIRVENLRAVLRLREKALCRNSDEIQDLKKQLMIAEMRIQRLCEMFLNLKKAHNELTTRARELEVELRDVTNAVKALPTSNGKKKPTAAEKLIEEVKKNARLTEENARLKKHLSSLTKDKGVPCEAFNFN